MYKLKLILLGSFLVLFCSCINKKDVIGTYTLDKFDPERIDNMYINMYIKEDNTFELISEDKQNKINGKWKLRWNNIIFEYDNKKVKGKLKDYGGFIVNSPNEFHSGHFSIIFYAKVDNN